MIGLGWIQPLDADKVPNLHKNLIKPLQGRSWDKDRTYSAPWQSGLTGIAYNAKLIKEVGSFEELITRPDLKGKITLLSEMRDTMAFMLKVVGADPDKFTDAEWEKAIEKLHKAVRAGQVRAFTGNEYIQDLTAGNIVACEAWSGDVIQAAVRQPQHQVRGARGGPVAVERQHARARTRRPTRPTPRSGSTTTTSPRWPRSSRPASTTSVRSRAPATRW